MSPRLPAVKPREIVRALERDGWRQLRQKGSHVALRKDGVAAVVTVSLHNRDMKPGTVRNILRMSGITEDSLAELLRQ